MRARLGVEEQLDRLVVRREQQAHERRLAAALAADEGMVVLLQLVVGDLEAVGAVRVRRLLRGPPLGVGPVAAVADRIRQRADEQRRERADRERLEQLGAAGGA
eukprot:3751391-Prymnesium_polylepis.1